MKDLEIKPLEKKVISEKEIHSESDSEKTEEDIIYNNCINDDEEEFLETENPQNDDIKNQNKINDLKNDKYQSQSEKKSNNNGLNKNKTNLTNIQIEQPKSRKNKFHDYYSPKFDFAKKKHKKKEEVKHAEDLFTEAYKKYYMKNSVNNNENDIQAGNTMSTKISDRIYYKYVGGKDSKKVNTIDVVINKMKDEEVNLSKEALRTKDDSKKINSMITRQEIFQKKKITNIQNKEKELSDKLNQECIFMPNGIVTSSRTIKDFNESQKRFLQNKKDDIDRKYREIYENNNNKFPLTSKQSEKIALAKNQNESKQQMYERLHFEKLKNLKESMDKPKEEKKMTKKEINNLSDKLYKENIKFKENKDKLTKEKLKKEMTQEDYISYNSNKVLLTKFLNYYKKILTEIFNRSDNFQINIDEYKRILNNMGCINPNLQSDEILIKESFFNILNPKEDKIETDSLLLFCLAALGIYKGNEDLKKPINIDNNNNINKIVDNNSIKTSTINRLSNKKNEKSKIKTINEILISSLPKINFDKNGFSNKIAKNIKQKFHPFVKGINESWSGDITKKKQQRREKLEISQIPRGNKITPKSHSKNKKIINNTINNNEYNNNKKITNNNNTINTNTNKYDEIYKRLQFHKDNNIKALQKKKEEEELALCTFQPNLNINNKNQNKANKKQIQKNIDKFYLEGKAAYIEKKKSIDPDPEDNIENRRNCTFKPVIHKFNNEVFINNPIKEDIQKLEKIGVQKMTQIGYKEYSKPMNFYIESKISKEDIVDRVIPERNSNNARNDENNNIIERDSDNALLKVEVNLDENNKTDKIIIFPGDDVKEKTLQFCAKHKLNEEKKNTLMNIILEKIQESQNIERKSDFRNINNYIYNKNNDINGINEDNNHIINNEEFKDNNNKEVQKNVELINTNANNYDMEKNNGNEINNIVKRDEN